MSFGPLIDVVIGLIFVYLLLGLITTAFQELLASYLKLRGKMLRYAIEKLLTDGNGASTLSDKVFGHPMVAGTSTKGLPSYVPSRNFALAVIDALSDGSQSPIFTQVEQQVGKIQIGPVRDALDSLVRHAGGDLDALKTSLATWYDDAMDRLSGDYKRNSQVISIACGAFFVVALNVNTIQIAESLWTNDALRAAVTASAQNFSQKNSGSPNADAQTQFNNSMVELFDLNLPIGWVTTAPTPQSSSQTPPADMQAWRGFRGYFDNLGLIGSLVLALGWAMTAFAASLGAPFWFGVLQQFLNFRGTGPKPPTAAAAAAGK